MEARPEGLGDDVYEETESKKQEKKAEEKKKDRGNERTDEKESESSKSPKRVSFSEARLIANAVNEALVVKTIDIGENQIRTLKNLLARHGVKLPEKPLEKYTPKEVKEMMVAVHKLLKKATVEDPVDADYKYTGAEERKREAFDVFLIEKGLIDKVKAADLDVSDFEVEVHKNFEVTKGLGAAEGDEGEAGKGTGETEESTAPQSREEIQRLYIDGQEAERQQVEDKINDLIITEIDSADWTSKKDALQAIIEDAKNDAKENRNYKKVNNVATALENAKGLYATGENAAKFKEIFDEKDMKSFTSDDGSENLLVKMNKHFLAKWRNMTDAQRAAIVGDIDQEADLFPGAIQSGWRSMDDAKERIYTILKRRPEPSGLREWRAVESLNGMRATIEESEKTRVPANPQDIQERLYNVFRKAEAAGLSTEDLGPILNEGLLLVRAMPSSTPEQRKRVEKLIHQLESFRGIHVFLIQLEKGDMNPEKVVQTFSELWEGREEITLEDFLSRYEEDDRGREFYMGKDEEGNEKKANLFDEEFRLYSERLRDERMKMNMIEEMTKHDLVERDFNDGEILEMMKGAGFNPKRTHGWDGERWEREINELRSYFVSRFKEKKIEFGDWGKAEKTKKIKLLIEEWHKQRSLHGAVGRVGESTEATEEGRKADEERQLKALAEEFNLQYESDDHKKKVREEFLGKQYLAIRREKLVEDFKKDLKRRGLAINKNFFWREGDTNLEGANFDDLSEKGYFESLDNTAYRMAWVMMWSNYDNIRIYSKDRKSNLHDIYEGTVVHSSTNLFNARAVDHVWEFYHSDAENRGRARHNETNEIWKQFLPGKHHYIFPQNTMLVRWASQFMSEAENKIVEVRTKIYMDKYDFHNPGREGREGYEHDYEGWMKNVVIMDMFENGELMLGEHKSMTDLARKKQLKKFEFIDVYGDRAKALAYGGTQEFQAYLANPTNAKFVELNRKDKFYSTRSARQFPWMTLATRAHWEIGNKHYKRLFDKDNMQSVDFEQVIQELVANGDMEKEAGEDFKKKNLGFVKISPHGDPEKLKNAPTLESNSQAFLFGSSWARRVRQAFEIGRKGSWDYRFAPLGVVAAFFVGIIGDIGKRFFKQTTGTDK